MRLVLLLVLAAFLFLGLVAAFRLLAEGTRDRRERRQRQDADLRDD